MFEKERRINWVRSGVVGAKLGKSMETIMIKKTLCAMSDTPKCIQIIVQTMSGNVFYTNPNQQILAKRWNLPKCHGTPDLNLGSRQGITRASAPNPTHFCHLMVGGIGAQPLNLE